MRNALSESEIRYLQSVHERQLMLQQQRRAHLYHQQLAAQAGLSAMHTINNMAVPQQLVEGNPGIFAHQFQMPAPLKRVRAVAEIPPSFQQQQPPPKRMKSDIDVPVIPLNNTAATVISHMGLENAIVKEKSAEKNQSAFPEITVPDLPPRPKKPLSAFLLFTSQRRPDLVASNPNMKGPEIIAMLGSMWRDAPETTKAVFTKLAKEAKEKYDEEVLAYKKKYAKEIKEHKQRKRILKRQRKCYQEEDVLLPSLPQPPKRPLSAYLHFCRDKRAELRSVHKTAHGREVLSQLSMLWDKMNEKEKSKYIEYAEIDSKRFNIEMNLYNSQHADVIKAHKIAKKNRQKQIKNRVPDAMLPKLPGKPKRATTAYLYFCMDTRPKLAEEGVTGCNVLKECARRWKMLSAEDRKPYVAKSNVDKARYTKERAEYLKKNKTKIEARQMLKKMLMKMATNSGDVYAKNKSNQPPRRYISAYLYFCKEQRPNVEREYPGLTSVEVVTKLGEMWRNTSEQERQPYNDMSEMDKTRYSKDYDKFVEENKAMEAEQEIFEQINKSKVSAYREMLREAQKERKKIRLQQTLSLSVPPKTTGQHTSRTIDTSKNVLRDPMLSAVLDPSHLRSECGA